MAFTYSKLAEVTVGVSGAATIDFNNIPQNYNDLIIKISVRNSSTQDQVILKVNSSSSSLSSRLVYGSGSAALSTSLTTGYAGTSVGTNQTASTFNNMEIYIPNYTSAANKSASVDSVMENNATASFVVLNAWLWSNVTAITSVTLNPDGGSFVQHSTATLYGVKAEV